MNVSHYRTCWSWLWSCVLLVVFCPQAQACFVCFGAKDDHTTNAISIAILFMLIFVMGVLASFVAFFIYLARRASQVDGEFDELAEVAFKESMPKPPSTHA